MKKRVLSRQRWDYGRTSRSVSIGYVNGAWMYVLARHKNTPAVLFKNVQHQRLSKGWNCSFYMWSLCSDRSPWLWAIVSGCRSYVENFSIHSEPLSLTVNQPRVSCWDESHKSCKLSSLRILRVRWKTRETAIRRNWIQLEKNNFLELKKKVMIFPSLLSKAE